MIIIIIMMVIIIVVIMIVIIRVPISDKGTSGVAANFSFFDGGTF